MSDWSSADLAAIDADGELRVAAHRHRPHRRRRRPQIDPALFRFVGPFVGVGAGWLREVGAAGCTSSSRISSRLT